MKTNPAGAEEALPGAMEALTMKSEIFPMKWWMLTIVQMEMVNLELFVTVIKPWWLKKKWRPGTHP
jgi:hypothetical protein